MKGECGGRAILEAATMVRDEGSIRVERSLRQDGQLLEIGYVEREREE